MINMDKTILKAKEKLINEKCEGMALILKKELISLIENDPALAEGVLNPLKNMQTCIKHLYKWASDKNTKKEKVLAIDHKSVYSEMIHYFLEVEEKKEEPKPTTITKTIENKPIQTIQPQSKIKKKEEVEYTCTLF